MAAVRGVGAAGDPDATVGRGGPGRTRRVAGVAAALVGAAAAGLAPRWTHAQAPAVLRLVLTEAPDTLDPLRALTPASRVVVRQLYEPLLRYGEGPAPEPGAAQEAAPNADATRWTFRLRPDLVWSDGRPLVAEDYVRGWLRLLGEKLPDALDQAFRPVYAAGVYRAGVVDPSSVGFVASDPHTVEVRLDGSAAHFPHVAALWMGAPRADQARPGSRGAAGIPGNGPFVVEAWHADQAALLGPNERYWAGPPRHALSLRFGQHAVDVALTDLASLGPAGQTASADGVGVGTGTADIVPVPEHMAEEVQRDARLARWLVRAPRPAVVWLACNTRSQLLVDARVRRALAAAIDREAFAVHVLGGAARPAYSVLPEGVLGHDPGAGREHRLDPDTARGRLREAGADAGRLAGLTLVVPDDAPGRRAAAFVREQLRQHLGVSIQVREIDRYAFPRAIEQRRFDLAFGGWESLYPDPEAWFWLVFGSGKAENRTGWESDAVDRLWRQADGVVDAAQRLALYQEAQRLVLAECPVIFLAQPERLAVVHPRVHSPGASAMDEVPGAGTFARVTLAGA